MSQPTLNAITHSCTLHPSPPRQMPTKTVWRNVASSSLCHSVSVKSLNRLLSVPDLGLVLIIAACPQMLLRPAE